MTDESSETVIADVIEKKTTKKATVVFEELPDKPDRNRSSEVAERLELLIPRPQEWARVFTNLKHANAQSKRRSILSRFEDFECELRRNDDETWNVYARYVGQNAAGDPQHTGETQIG